MANDKGFLDWGGAPQSVYEQWRQASLGGEPVECFLLWGMSLLAPARWEQGRRVLEVRRRRASVRAGEFSLAQLLLELGILGDDVARRLSPRLELKEMEVCR